MNSGITPSAENEFGPCDFLRQLVWQMNQILFRDRRKQYQILIWNCFTKGYNLILEHFLTSNKQKQNRTMLPKFLIYNCPQTKLKHVKCKIFIFSLKF